MRVPLPSTPMRIAVIAAAIGIAVTFAAAALSAEPMSFWDRLLVAACQAVITLAFAVVGVNAIADRWRKREWARRTQYVALLLF